MRLPNPKQRNFFAASVKNNFNMRGVGKSRTCVRYVLEIKFYKFPYLIIYFLASTFTNTMSQFPEF